ncbi:LysM peptidoglycan-binding domain-containing protein [Ancylomarina sp. DW003]|nr:glycoside hydrolase family 19 protein [Ancylomarina sp. DW003]MDE5422606.1 LysM peptidoglycan-binding domain-containing protein [Ancylomarina sp. DW003]
MKKYTIKAGDTLGSIAKTFYKDAMKYKEIAEANNIVNPNIVIPGQEILLPGIKDDAVSNDTKHTGGLVLTLDCLSYIMPQASEENIWKYLEALNSQLPKFGINTPLRMAHFIAQIGHESGSFKYNSENLNYSEKALRAVFGKYFPSDELAQAYARQPEKIANRVYANRMKNGDEASGDGWKFRGRGLIQLTGRDNYTQCGFALKLDLINQPELLANDANAAVEAAAWFWNSRELNAFADKDDIKGITRRINGGYNGLEDREAYLVRAKEIFINHKHMIV